VFTWIELVRTTAIGIVLALAVPVSARAATTIGSPLTEHANLFTACDSSPTTLASPITGVITRWRVRSVSLGTVTLRVLRPNGDGTFTAVGSSLPQSLTQRPARGEDASYTFPTRISVQQGDYIALDRNRQAGGVYRQVGGDSFGLGVFVPPLPDSETGSPEAGQSGVELMLNADVEVDADGDGFGDETQDNCPSIPNDQSSNPCPSKTTPGQQTGSTGTGDTGPPVPVWRRHRGRRAGGIHGRRGPASDTFHRHGARHAATGRVARRRQGR